MICMSAHMCMCVCACAYEPQGSWYPDPWGLGTQTPGDLISRPLGE